MKCSSGLLLNMHTFIEEVSPARIRKVFLSKVTKQLLVLLVGVSVNFVGVHYFFQMVISPKLESGYAEFRESIEVTFIHHQVEDRKRLRREELGPKCLKTTPMPASPGRLTRQDRAAT